MNERKSRKYSFQELQRLMVVDKLDQILMVPVSLWDQHNLTKHRGAVFDF